MPKHLQTGSSTTSDIGGTLPSSLSVDKIKGKTINTTGAANNGALTYSSTTDDLQFKVVPSTVTKKVIFVTSPTTHSMSGTTPVMLMDLVIPTPGTYLVEFSTYADISRRGAAGYYALYNSVGTMLAESERIIDNSGTNSAANMLRWGVYVMGVFTTTSVNETVSVRVRSTANNNTVTTYHRSMTALKLN